MTKTIFENFEFGPLEFIWNLEFGYWNFIYSNPEEIG
jgi:hypothetical protein